MTTPRGRATVDDGGSVAVADHDVDPEPVAPDDARGGTPRPPTPIAWALPLTAAVVFAVDQATKTWALRSLSDQTIDLIGSLRLNLAFNTGAAFSGGSGLGPFIAVAVLVIVVVLIAQRHRVITTGLGTIAVGMIAGGAFGNLADRVFRAGDGFLGGAVVDFIDLQWWPIFNVADAAVVLGGLALVIESSRVERRSAP